MRQRAGLAAMAMLMIANDHAHGAQLLHSIFQDHVVLQRDQPIRVWGRAQPNERVVVTLGSDRAEASADGAGKWVTQLPAHEPTAGLTLVASGSSTGRQTVLDVAVGDVWLCSGQSNMVLQVHRALDARSEIANANNTSIRMLTVPQASSAISREEFGGPVQWLPATSNNVNEFSASCYYFARELQKTVKVPMGLITSAWGGSKIETWMSAPALRATGRYNEALDILALHPTDPLAAHAQWGSAWERWWRSKSKGTAEPWQVQQAGEWRRAPSALGFWETYGDPELADHNGMVWYRTTFEVSAKQAALPFTLSLGHVDEVEQTWLNGKPIGADSNRTSTAPITGPGPERTYRLPAGALQPGTNVIVINVLDTYATGGLHGPEQSRFVKFENGELIALDGDWFYRRVPADVGTPPRAPWEAVAGLGVIHNAMIAPFAQFAIRGVAWYQGESNTDAAHEYVDLLTQLMADWRSNFNQALPFLIVQLANYGTPPSAPVESGWAELREAQRRAVHQDDNAALVVTIDIGDRYDIHPANKQEVGRRLARAARQLVFGESIVPTGPTARAARREGRKIVVSFDDVTGKLITYSAAQPIGFEVCGSTAESCQFVSAHITNNSSVLLDADAVSDPNRVRYCWADSPVCTLFDEARLPAGPFQLEVR